MTGPNQQVVLSLFPGADLFGKAFESRGFCVVRGPELLLGQDVRDFHVPAGRFDGVIGGPPCTKFSACRNRKQSPDAADLIDEFARIVDEAKPGWMVMENVRGAKASPHIRKDWAAYTVRDYDCGGMTNRTRTFWFWPGGFFDIAEKPEVRKDWPGPLLTLLASDGSRSHSGGWRSKGHSGIDIVEAARIQGYPEVGKILQKANEKKGLSKHLGVRYLGNGVPRAMGEWVADLVVRCLAIGAARFPHRTREGECETMSEIEKPDAPDEFWCWVGQDGSEYGRLIVSASSPVAAARQFAEEGCEMQNGACVAIRVLTHDGEVYEVTLVARNTFAYQTSRRRWPKDVKP